MDTTSIPPAGDPFTSAPAHRSAEQERLHVLEERYRHELMDDEECQELRDQVLSLRRLLRRLSR